MSNIDGPLHYLAARETINDIADSMSVEAFHGFCLGNEIKYRSRAGKKGAEEEDIGKADWYAQMANHVLSPDKVSDPRDGRMYEPIVGAAPPRVVLDSVSPFDPDARLITVEVDVPLLVWVHILTHRSFSRNAQSARAMPVEAIIRRARYVPGEWPKNGRGMSPSGEVAQDEADEARRIWLEAMFSARKFSRELAENKIHKEIANRLLSPFMLIKGIITGDKAAWNWFFHLRLTPQAQTDTRRAAAQILEAIKASTPVERHYHLPYAGDYRHWDDVCASAGRCARVSYLNHVGEADGERDVELGKRLAEDEHLSPFDHCCVALSSGNGTIHKGWATLRPAAKQFTPYI